MPPTQYAGPGPAPFVLVVDDNADAADSLVELLTLYGFAAQAEYSGQAALAAARDVRPDVVVLDLVMPGMTGWELAAALGRLARPPVVVAVSGLAPDRCREMSRAAGVHLHLVKPADPEVLAGVLSRIRRATPDPAAERHASACDRRLATGPAGPTPGRKGTTMPGSDPNLPPLNPDGGLTQLQYTAEVRRLLVAAARPLFLLPAAFPIDAALCFSLALTPIDAAVRLLREYAAA